MNQNPEQKARDKIDKQLLDCGWVIQNKNQVNLSAGIGIAIREFQTDVGPADYVLFVDKIPVGLIEAKREEEGIHLRDVHDQSMEYATAKLKHLNHDPLNFVYESTGTITHFTDYRDPKPRVREVFTFHRPETIREWVKKGSALRNRLLSLPALPVERLRDCQIKAINQLEVSFKENKPRALIQMATGSGKTFTAITFIYRLLKFAGAKRILFLVDTKNLGEQAEQEFMAYQPNDDNRKFKELYGVQRLKSGFIPSDNQVYISTIQRMYSILRGTELDEAAEEDNPNESQWQPREPLPVVYNPKVPIEFFDFVVIDECHRSIYNLWKQVLDYFDAFLIGLTATPDNRTFGFFKQNVVSEYTHEDAVLDGVNVGSDVYIIETDITRNGSVLWKGQYVDKREKLSRRKRWEMLDEDMQYTNKQLDDAVVNPNQIRLILQTFRQRLPEMFPDRFIPSGSKGGTEFEVPKTLIFAKTDSHADDIIRILLEVFGEENKFCKKITYKASEDPKNVLQQFRREYYPRIAVTVDMIATGTDVKPLECLLFMRDVKSRNYFEQMKGRGTRTIDLDDLQKVSRAARSAKDHFVIVDAIGVTRSLKTDSRPLEKKPGVPLKDLLKAVAFGSREEELFTSLANRLSRLDKQLTEKEKTQFAEKTGGFTLGGVARNLLEAYNPDVVEAIEQEVKTTLVGEAPDTIQEAVREKHQALIEKTAEIFTGELNQWIENVRRAHEQIIDEDNQDTLLTAAWDKDNQQQAEQTVQGFAEWLQQHSDEIAALQIFYHQPYRRRDVSYAMVKEVLEILKTEKPSLAPFRVWSAYEKLKGETARSLSTKAELVVLVSLIRRACGLDQTLNPFDKTVDRNFQQWILKKNAGQHNRFTEAQMDWLRMVKEHIATSFHIERDDLDLNPFNSLGGLGKMWQLFGEETDGILEEMNEALTA
jgi:type I restriction enzyme R subunit